MPYCSGGRSDFLIDRHQGDVRVTVHTVPDDDWYSCTESKFTSLSDFDANWTRYRDWALVARNERVIRMPGSDIWRDERGRIAPAPRERAYSHEWEFIAVPAKAIGAETVKHVLAEADMLDDLNRGHAIYYGVIAQVYVDGAEIGEASVWGVYSDFSRDSERYVHSVARDMAHEAIRDAREWLNRQTEKASA